MTTYTFAQLEGLWIQAGGSKALAPLMAGVAEVESGGNDHAYNPSTASGLWQLVSSNWHLIPGGAANRFDGPSNARGAVLLSGNTMAGIQSNWLAFEPPGAAEAIAKKNSGTVPQQGTIKGIQGTVPGVSAPGSTASGGVSAGSLGTAGTITGTGPDPSAPGGIIGFAEGLPIIGGLVKAIEPLLHAVATVIDYSFTMFEPGQGPRALFGAGALILAFLSYRVLASSGVAPHLPGTGG